MFGGRKVRNFAAGKQFISFFRSKQINHINTRINNKRIDSANEMILMIRYSKQPLESVQFKYSELNDMAKFGFFYFPFIDFQWKNRNWLRIIYGYCRLKMYNSPFDWHFMQS